MVEGPSCGTLTFSVRGHPVSHALWHNISIILVREQGITRQFLVVDQVSFLPELLESESSNATVDSGFFTLYVDLGWKIEFSQLAIGWRAWNRTCFASFLLDRSPIRTAQNVSSGRIPYVLHRVIGPRQRAYYSTPSFCSHFPLPISPLCHPRQR